MIQSFLSYLQYFSILKFLCLYKDSRLFFLLPVSLTKFGTLSKSIMQTQIVCRFLLIILNCGGFSVQVLILNIASVLRQK